MTISKLAFVDINRFNLFLFKRKVSVAELARRMGVDRTSIYRWNRIGWPDEPEYSPYAQMAEVLGVSRASLTRSVCEK